MASLPFHLTTNPNKICASRFPACKCSWFLTLVLSKIEPFMVEKTTVSTKTFKLKHRPHYLLATMSPPRGPVPSPALNRRMQVLLTEPNNRICADCPADRPRWVSFLHSPINKGERVMGVFCCTKCAQHHQFVLGKKRCTIKCVKVVNECKFARI